MTNQEIRDILVCPTCHGSLHWSIRSVACDECGREFVVNDEIPVLVETDEATRASSAPEEPLKSRQASFFDEETDVEFEISRPRSAGRLYEWLMAEKFSRSVSALRDHLSGATVLCICGGSGMDAEFLAKCGARVIVSDLSLGAMQRARERARRGGFPLFPVVADAERLPFRTRSVDLVYVHDGLHHLERPALGLREMARVADVAISLNEPARAALTNLGIKLGVALEVETAGNRVARLSVPEVSEQLQELSFSVVHASRYGMFYRHHPGAVMRWFSRAPLLPVATSAIRWANRALGSVGNKLTVQALRQSDIS